MKPRMNSRFMLSYGTIINIRGKVQCCENLTSRVNRHLVQRMHKLHSNAFNDLFSVYKCWSIIPIFSFRIYNTLSGQVGRRQENISSGDTQLQSLNHSNLSAGAGFSSESLSNLVSKNSQRCSCRYLPRAKPNSGHSSRHAKYEHLGYGADSLRCHQQHESVR